MFFFSETFFTNITSQTFFFFWKKNEFQFLNEIKLFLENNFYIIRSVTHRSFQKCYLKQPTPTLHKDTTKTKQSSFESTNTPFFENLFYIVERVTHRSFQKRYLQLPTPPLLTDIDETVLAHLARANLPIAVVAVGAGKQIIQYLALGNARLLAKEGELAVAKRMRVRAKGCWSTAKQKRRVLAPFSAKKPRFLRTIGPFRASTAK